MADTFNPTNYLITIHDDQIYLPVAARVIWFRHDRPDWGIETHFETLDLEHMIAICTATVRDENGRIRSQATKCETLKGFPDFVEKAQTGAIGRALALCGFGTQFAQDLDEGDRTVDPPTARPSAAAPGNGQPAAPAATLPGTTCPYTPCTQQVDTTNSLKATALGFTPACRAHLAAQATAFYLRCLQGLNSETENVRAVVADDLMKAQAAFGPAAVEKGLAAAEKRYAATRPATSDDPFAAQPAAA